MSTLWRSWFWTVTAAEFCGFLAPAAAGALAAGVPVVVAAGAVEGAMLGWGQAVVLKRVLPGLSCPRWTVATAAGAVLAYLAGFAPSVAYDAGLSLLAVVPVAAVVLLVSLGGSQWLVLRRLVVHAVRWIFATAAAWVLGLTVFMAFAMPLWQAGQPIWLLVTIGAGGGLLMAATSSAITGWALRWVV